MAKYVTEEHFDASIARLDKKFVTIDHFDATVGELRNDIMDKMEGMTTILQRLDQERLFTVEWIRRIESDVSLMKHHLKLA